ncbi:unnamed protein product [Staurois parvus]|uniref:BPTI/Kunitz inhibitor domain-containing protein n=1 Tax=Staurois parvus TaxID=386267 RepID=A0ABN9HH28_9NEOB|nr:unnamed protein product [Staurois parvus]
MKRYYFDRTTNSCRTFTYGGCLGNGNNFKTKFECQHACMTGIFSLFHHCMLLSMDSFQLSSNLNSTLLFFF